MTVAELLEFIQVNKVPGHFVLRAVNTDKHEAPYGIEVESVDVESRESAKEITEGLGWSEVQVATFIQTRAETLFINLE